MKKIIKILNIFLIIYIVFSAFANVWAADIKTSLQVIKQASETKYLENDQGYISKTIVNSKPETGEITIEVKVSNLAKDKENTQTYEDTEIYMMVSENISTSKNTEKIEKYIDDIVKLSSNIVKVNSKTKIGIIGIKGTIRDSQEDENGNLNIGDNDEREVNGSKENAEIVVEPTNKVEDIRSGLQNMNSSKTSYYSNLQAAIRLANKSYSNNTNKILISLFDGVPNIAIGVKEKVSYGGWTQYNTVEEAVKAKYENVATYTRNEILELKNNDVSFILLRPADTSYDESWYDTSTGEKILDFDGSPYVQKLYGTIENPTYGKMYNFTDENIDTIIAENIYQDVKLLMQSDINSVKVTDYFPKEILNNFDITIHKPSTGTTSNEIDKETNTLEWNIEILEGNSVGTLQYTLKLKDMENENLLEKTISTNEKIVLQYKDINEKEYTVTLSSSPQVKLSQIVQEDTTTAPTEIPQTGQNIFAGVLIITILIILIISYIKARKYKNI